MKVKKNYIYNYPSTINNSIKIEDKNIIQFFNEISNDYTTISAYDYTNGSFRGHNYRFIIKKIANFDLINILTPQDSTIIFDKLSEFIKKVQNEENQKYYKDKYPYSKNYPIHLGYYYKLAPLSLDDLKPYFYDPYYLAYSELLFLKKLFYVYSSNNLFLIPKIE